MNALPSVSVWAQWLSDYSLSIVLAMALLAFATEALYRFRQSAHRAHQRSPATAQRQKRPRGSNPQWAATWRTNAALLAISVALTCSLAAWLSPLFSAALSGQTGLLVWLGVAHAPNLVAVLLGILLLDVVVYAMHRVMHAVPLLWRIHQVHHSDTAMNASTHFRQHPLQLLATTLMQLPLLWLLGIPGVSWVLYALLSAVVELWHHSAIRLPMSVDRWLGWLVVTPNFHRTHHNPQRLFHDANYGAVFPHWDRLFATFASAPLDASVGLSDRRPAKSGSTLTFSACLAMPFRKARTAPTTPATHPVTAVARASVIGRKLKMRQKLQPNSRGTT